jgi:RNA polymerase sigma-70 factor (ECF subfamily)
MPGAWESLSDSELVAAIQRRTLGAFGALVGRYERSLINFFYHLGWDPQVAEDCAQEVFLRLYRHLDTYEPQAKFTTFLFRVARNLWIDRKRAEAIRGKPLPLEGRVGEEPDRAVRERVAGPGPSPVEILTRRETEEALRAAIDHLPEEQKAVVILSEIQGLKYQEIGQILNVPVGTVKSRMHTAIEKLKERLADLESV